MPWNKTMKTQRKYRKKRYGYKKKGLASKVNFALKLAKRAQGQKEKKYSTYNVTGSLTAAGWNNSYIYRCLNIAQGDGPSDRDGNVIYLQNLISKFRVRPSGDLTTGASFRFFVLQDKQTVADSTNPSYADIFQTTDMNSPYNYPAVVNRFKILYDKIFPVKVLFSGGYASGGATFVDHTINHSQYKEFNLNKFFKTIRYNGTTAADVQKNAIYWGICVDEAITLDYEVYFMSKYVE